MLSRHARPGILHLQQGPPTPGIKTRTQADARRFTRQAAMPAGIAIEIPQHLTQLVRIKTDLQIRRFHLQRQQRPGLRFKSVGAFLYEAFQPRQ